MSYFKPPIGWYWAHDIEPAQIAQSLLIPDARLVRLASYGAENRLRFASIIYYKSSSIHKFVLDIEPAKLEETCHALNAQPIGIDSYKRADKLYFALILEEQAPELETALHYDLSGTEVRHYLESGSRIVDFTIYESPAGQQFAIITEKSNIPGYWFAGLSKKELQQALKKAKANPVRLRGYQQGAIQLYAAVALDAQFVTDECIWYTGLDADEVARKLEKHKAYPLDLDPYKDNDTLYFNVIMCKEK